MARIDDLKAQLSDAENQLRLWKITYEAQSASIIKLKEELKVAEEKEINLSEAYTACQQRVRALGVEINAL